MWGALAALGLGLVSAYMGKKGAQAQADAIDKQNRYALELEKQKLELARNSPGARFAPFGFDSALSVFSNSMAGKMSKFNLKDAQINMGLRYPGSDKYGPLYGGFDFYNNWSKSHPSPLLELGAIGGNKPGAGGKGGVGGPVGGSGGRGRGLDPTDRDPDGGDYDPYGGRGDQFDHGFGGWGNVADMNDPATRDWWERFGLGIMGLNKDWFSSDRGGGGGHDDDLANYMNGPDARGGNFR